MAEQIELALFGLANVTTAIVVTYGVVADEIAPGWIVLAGASAFFAVVFAVRLGLAVHESGEGR